MAFQLKTAERESLKLKIGIQGPTGSGKTYSALLMAYGICGDWEKVFFIDTENKSATYYSSLGPFVHGDLNPPYSPEAYIEAITACEAAGAEVIVIDSMSHEWEGEGGCLEMADYETNRMQRPNSYVAWGKVTPRHKKFVDRIRLSPVHVICCSRSKMDYAIEKNEKGKNEIRKVGLKSIQREGLEYEWGIVFELDMEHMAYAGKDRTGLFMDKPRHMITPDTGKKLLDWANNGKDPEDEIYEGTDSQKVSFAKICELLGAHTQEEMRELSEHCLGKPISELSGEIKLYMNTGGL